MASGLMRNLTLSVYYRMLQLFLQQGWTSPEIGVTLPHLTTYLPEQIPIADNTYGLQEGTPWVFIDASGYANPAPVTVYDNGVPLASGAYNIDYMHASVILNAPPSGEVTADFTRFTVRATPAFLLDTQLNYWELPIVSVSVDAMKMRSLDIGSANMFVTSNVSLDIMANSNNELNELTYDLVRYMDRVVLTDYTSRQPLTYTGAIDPLFDPQAQFIQVLWIKRKPEATMIDPKRGNTVKQWFSGLVTFAAEKIV